MRAVFSVFFAPSEFPDLIVFHPLWHHSDTGFEMDEPAPPTESAGPEPSNGLSGTASGALSNTASANPSANTSLVMGVNERLETLAEGGGSDAQIEGGSTVSKATAGECALYCMELHCAVLYAHSMIYTEFISF